MSLRIELTEDIAWLFFDDWRSVTSQTSTLGCIATSISAFMDTGSVTMPAVTMPLRYSIAKDGLADEILLLSSTVYLLRIRRIECLPIDARCIVRCTSRSSIHNEDWCIVIFISTYTEMFPCIQYT